MSRRDFAHSSLYPVNFSFIHVPVMRSDGKKLSLDKRARHAGEFFMKLFLPCIQCWQKLCCFLPPQAARSGDIKSVTASVNNSTDTNTVADIFDFPATEDCDRHFRRERAQDCPSGIHKHGLVRPTDNRLKRAVVVEKSWKDAVV